jgi:ribosomal protein S18 acetylase RimI-like enzyme
MSTSVRGRANILNDLAISCVESHANATLTPLFTKPFGRANVMSVIRNAETAEIPQLARIWFDAWQDAHAQILPAELARIRTLESFGHRLRSALAETRVAGPQKEPVGFCIVRGDELYQLFVAASARGTGVAADLLADGEARLARNGFETAWLACAIGNERAARFYEKHGWINVGSIVSQLDTPNGRFPLEVWRYEKRLRQASVATVVAKAPIV